MSGPGNANYDVVIIGAGISGLVSGCYLAKAGMKVLLVEHHDKPGGYCASFKRQGFLFDAAAHSFGSYREGGNFRQIAADLGLDNMIRIVRCNPSDIVLAPDFTVTFWNEAEDTVKDLVKIFPREERNIKRYFDFYRNQTAADQSENIRLKDKTFADVLKSFFTDDALISAISLPILGNGGLPPALMHAFTGTKIFGEFLLDGGYYPEGGMQEIPNALARIIQSNGGTMLYKRLVKKILIRSGAVTGIELDDNEIINAKYVVSACDITQLYTTLLGEGVVGREHIQKLETMKPSMSTFTLYLGLDKPFEGLPREGTNIWYLPHYDLDRLFSELMLGDVNHFGGGGLMFRVSPDKKTILAFCGAPYKTDAFWKQNKKRIAADFLSRVEGLVPNLKDHVVYFDAATPQTLHRYTLNHEGANYGWAPLQAQLFDPAFRQKTSFKGLYLTGHWTAQTHGIPGVSYLGHNTAKLILKQENQSIGGR